MVLTAGALIGGGSWQSAVAATQCCDCGPQGGGQGVQQPGRQDDEEEDPPPPSHGSNHGLLIIDNSNADSWLEVDRTLNTLVDSKGTAGSDHDGDGGDIEVARPPAGSPGAPAAPGHPTASEGDD